MLIEPGQLQKKEEERSALGVANKPLENLDKDDGEKKDYTFYNLRESKDTQQRQPGEIRSGNQTPSREEQAASAAQQREREDSDAEPRRDRTFSLPGTQPGARNSGELSLPGLFDPGKRDALSSADSKSEFSLPGLFANAPARTDKDNARMKNFNDNILNSGPGLSTPAAGNSLILPQSSASFARPQDNFSSRPAGGNLFDSGASLNSGLAPGLPNRLASPGFLAPNNSAASPGASPFFSQGQAQQNPSRNWSAPAMEPPRRKF